MVKKVNIYNQNDKWRKAKKNSKGPQNIYGKFPKLVIYTNQNYQINNY